jgi:hypothetical protein
MKPIEDIYNPDLNKGNTLLGYLVKRKIELDHIHAVLYDLEHLATGAKHIHISRPDKENTFSVALKTVPKDSTGVAHILEHTVLCGSKRYSVRDPFFSMLKRSLSTFMNAFTASDWTMYPFSTQNKKDFYNLMAVYLDAVFFPNLDELSFKQEGHRMEINGDPKTVESFELNYKGVVYNEMKGAMSSPDQVMARSILNALYPLTTYHNNSGGDPAVIPELTYEQLVSFHQQHYHPSNAFFFTYGDLPLEAHLSFIQKNILTNFKRIDPDTEVPAQPRWDKPKKVVYTYPLDKNENPSKKFQICLAWLTSDVRNDFDILVLMLLEQILLGNAASPVRKALIDSQLGSALSDGTGFVSDQKDTLFTFGLKDVESESEEAIETLILDVMRSLVKKGIDKTLVESAIHQIEFHHKEITNQPYPYGIKLLISFCGAWFHGGDPAQLLNFDSTLKNIRSKIAQGHFLENQIKRFFIENPHRILLTLSPDPEKEENENRRVHEELADIKNELAASDFARLIKDAQKLEKLQEAKEDISSLPTLQLTDVSPDIVTVNATASKTQVPVVRYEQPTSGIFYLTSAASTSRISREQLFLVPFFCYALSKIGTSDHDYVEMARRIDLYTGGIGAASHSRTRYDKTGTGIPFISLNGKCLFRNQEAMFDILEALVFCFDFSDFVNLKNLLLEFRAGLESAILHNGHQLAMSLAARNFSQTCALSEDWHGIHQLKKIKDLTRDLADEQLQRLSGDLEKIGKLLFSKDNLKLAFVGEAEALDHAFKRVVQRKGLSAIGQDPLKKNHSDPSRNTFGGKMTREGWSTAAAVSFVAQTFKTVRLHHKDAPALSVIAKILRSMYLHREIREKGGAYGGFAVYDSENGLFSFGSYRDPHIVSTLKTYEKAAAFICSGSYEKEDVKEAILQVCSDIDKPDSPGTAARKAFYRTIVSLHDETRKQFKTKLLSTDRDQVVSIARKYFGNSNRQQATAVISNEERLKTANAKLSTPLQLLRI